MRMFTNLNRLYIYKVGAGSLRPNEIVKVSIFSRVRARAITCRTQGTWQNLLLEPSIGYTIVLGVRPYV